MAVESRRPPPGSEASLALIRKELGTAGDIHDENPWRQRFWAFHALNDQVYKLLEAYCVQVRKHRPEGKKIGIALPYHRMRWELFFTTTGDEFKLNQNFCAYYARLLIDKHPDWDGMFEFRELGRHAGAGDDDW